MTLNQLRAFLASARMGSFTAAAADLAMAQASVSELVRRLEEENGLPLFVRGARRLLLTSAGEELLPFAEASVAAADNGGEALRSMRSLGGGVATFGLLRNASYYLLSELAQQFHEMYPDVRIRLIGQNSVEVAAAVSSGELEAGLVVLPIDDDGLKVTTLGRDEVLYASADASHLTAPITMEQLSKARLILYDAHYGWSDPTRRQIAERAKLLGLKIEPLMEVEHVESALNLVSHGVGDTIICQAVAESVTRPPNVDVVPFADPLYDTIALIQRESAVLSPATREIARLARRMLVEGRPAGMEPREAALRHSRESG